MGSGVFCFFGGILGISEEGECLFNYHGAFRDALKT
jgi:hypothetical protein